MRTTFSLALRAALAAAVVGLTVNFPNAALAQSRGAPQPPQQGSGAYIGPGTKGQMGSTRNHERWAAAARKADKHAEHVRKHGKAEK